MHLECAPDAEEREEQDQQQKQDQELEMEDKDKDQDQEQAKEQQKSQRLTMDQWNDNNLIIIQNKGLYCKICFFMRSNNCFVSAISNLRQAKSVLGRVWGHALKLRLIPIQFNLPLYRCLSNACRP